MALLKGGGGGGGCVSAVRGAGHSPALLSASDWMRDAQAEKRSLRPPGLTVKRELKPRTHLYGNPDSH